MSLIDHMIRVVHTLQARYKTSFQAASNQSMMNRDMLPSQPPPQPVESTKKKRKSRWD